MKTLIRKITASVVVAMGLVGVANANSFQGTVWSLSYSGFAQPDSDFQHQTYRITLGVDTNGYTPPQDYSGQVYLDQVAIKVSSSVSAASLISAPTGIANWQLMSTGLSANGCSGGSNGFECANSTLSLNGGKGVAINPGNGVGVDYTWVFDITMNNGSLFTAALAPSVKGRFVDANGGKIGALVSEDVSLNAVPLPAAAWLFGSALLGFVSLSSRRKV